MGEQSTHLANGSNTKNKFVKKEILVPLNMQMVVIKSCVNKDYEILIKIIKSSSVLNSD